jgi:hypothetical protein
MNPEKPSRSSSPTQRQFAGCVELIPPQPLFIEFVTADSIQGFPIRQLSHFSLESNPDHQDKKTSPPDQLLLFYGTAVVVLRGWRLELMLGPLVGGRIARVHAEKHLGALMLGEAWVSKIYVIRIREAGSMKDALEEMERR